MSNFPSSVPQPNGEAAIVSVIPVALSCAPDEMDVWAKDALASAHHALAPQFGLLAFSPLPGPSAWVNPVCGPKPLSTWELIAQRLGDDLSPYDEFRVHQTSSAVGAYRKSHSLVEWTREMSRNLREACLRDRPSEGLVVLARLCHHSPSADVAHVCVVYPSGKGTSTWTTEPMSPDYLPEHLRGSLRWKEHWAHQQGFDAVMDIFARTRIQSAWKPLLARLREIQLDHAWAAEETSRSVRPRF